MCGTSSTSLRLPLAGAQSRALSCSAATEPASGFLRKFRSRCASPPRLHKPFGLVPLPRNLLVPGFGCGLARPLRFPRMLRKPARGIPARNAALVFLRRHRSRCASPPQLHEPPSAFRSAGLKALRSFRQLRNPLAVSSAKPGMHVFGERGILLKKYLNLNRNLPVNPLHDKSVQISTKTTRCIVGRCFLL